LVAEWQALTLFCHSFQRFAIKQSQTALLFNAIKGEARLPFYAIFVAPHQPSEFPPTKNLSTLLVFSPTFFSKNSCFSKENC